MKCVFLSDVPKQVVLVDMVTTREPHKVVPGAIVSCGNHSN